MFRLPSAFEAPPGPGPLSALLEDPAVEFAHIIQTSIVLGHDDSPSAMEANHHIEPLPHIDYHLIFVLLNLCYGGKINKREVKRYDYLIDARKHYYRSHYLFVAAFNNLQDAHAYGLQLEHEKTKLERSGSGTAEDLEIITSAIQKNYMDLNYRLGELIERRNRRLFVTGWFSSMKNDFIKSEMSRLNFVGKQAYQRNLHLKALAHQIPPVITQKTSGSQYSGLLSSGPRSSEPQSSMPQSSGLLSSGPRSSEPQFTRFQFSEPLISEPRFSEPQFTRPQSSEPLTSEPRSSGLLSSGPRSSAPQFTRPQPSAPLTSEPRSSAPQSSGLLSSGPRSSGPQFTRPQPSGPRSSGPQSFGPRFSGPRFSRPQFSRPQSSRPQTSDIPLHSQSLSSMLNDEMSVEALLREAARVNNQSQQLPGHVVEEEEDPNAMDLS